MIEFIDVGKTYPNNMKALEDINLQIEKGEFVAVIGPSGAGKSTLLRCINRMHDISEGKLIVDGVEVNSLKGKEIRTFRQRIGMIFQSYNLVTRISVIKNVLVSFAPNLPFWRKVLGIFSKDHKVKALTALDQVGILDKAYVRVDQLSGGQQQRVALARTLAQNPDIILADEPIASLDPVTAKQVMDDFKRINRETNISVIINIHHVEIALEYADRIIGIRKGKIVYDGKAGDLTDEELDYIYKGQTEELKESGRGRRWMYDKIFPPAKISLPNGKIVYEKRSRTPLILVLLVIATIISVQFTNFDLNILLKRWTEFFVIIGQMIPPNWEYLSYIWQPLLDTIKMSLLGSILGSIAAVPAAYLASANIVGKPIAGVAKFFLSILRTLPTLVTALIATFIFGLGTLAGTVAIFLFTVAYVGKLLYEQIENADMGSFEAMESIGMGRLQAFRYAIFPQVLPNYISTSLFSFEGNVRYAAILGYVGAGGIGLLINESLGWRDYSRVGMILLMLIITVYIIEKISEHFRKKLI